LDIEWPEDNQSLATLVDALYISNPDPRKDGSFPIPLLLWIDDEPENVIHSMRYAESLGVYVISITSTASAKNWIDTNSGM
jgi:hypothetical protein